MAGRGDLLYPDEDRFYLLVDALSPGFQCGSKVKRRCRSTPLAEGLVEEFKYLLAQADFEGGGNRRRHSVKR